MVVASGRLKFVFDECLSPHITRVIDHCGCRITPQISARTLTKEERLLSDPEWIRARAENGFIIVSRDRRMISDHDIARVAEEIGAIIFLLDDRVSRQNRWEMFKWFGNHFPSMATHALKVNNGTTWIVGHDGRIRAVTTSPSLPVSSG